MTSPPTPNPYAPWLLPDFRRYACGSFAATFAQQAETLVVSVVLVDAYSSQNAPLALGLMALVRALPVMLLAIAGGQIADRFDRGRVLVLMFSLGALSSAGLLAVAVLGAPVGWYYPFLALGAAALAIANPSRQALLPGLVPAEIFSNATAWGSSTFYTATVTGPVVAGFLLDRFSYSAGPAAAAGLAASRLAWPVPALAMAVLCRLLGVAAIAALRYRRTNHSEATISWQSVLAGIHFVWRTKLFRATITLDLFAVLLGGATYLLPIFAKEILKVGSTELGILRAADAVGAIAMALTLAHRPPLRRAGVTLLWAVTGFGAATVVFGLSPWFWLSVLTMCLVGAFDNISVVVRHTLVQMLTPDEMRGRVSAVNSVFIVASNDLGGAESGITAWLFGPVLSVVGGGLGAIFVVLAVMRLWPQILRIGALDSIRPESLEEATVETPTV
jgi:MFS family permease